MAKQVICPECASGMCDSCIGPGCYCDCGFEVQEREIEGVPCPHCNGTGIAVEGWDCLYCDGEGELPI